MFAKENVRERERSEGAQSTSDATSDTSRYRYIRAVFCLGRELRDSVSFIGIVVALNFIHMPEMYSF